MGGKELETVGLESLDVFLDRGDMVVAERGRRFERNFYCC